MKTVAVIQARQTSTRLPGKMMLPLAGTPVIKHIIDRARSVKEIDLVCVTIPEGPAPQSLVDFIGTLDGVAVSRGPEENLLRRFALASEETQAELIVRLWGDCPAIDPSAIRELLTTFAEFGAAWGCIDIGSGYPHGNECQIFRAKDLIQLDKGATDVVDQEFPDRSFRRDPERYPLCNVKRPEGNHPLEDGMELLLDTEEDYRKLGKIFDRLYPLSPFFGLAEIEALQGDLD